MVKVNKFRVRTVVTVQSGGGLALWTILGELLTDKYSHMTHMTVSVALWVYLTGSSSVCGEILSIFTGTHDIIVS